MTGTEGNDKQDLWQSILSDVTSHTASRHLSKKNVLVLGDEGAGRSSLIARLQGRKYNPEEHAQGTGLEYTYLDVKDEDTSEDVVARLGVYTLDGNVAHKNLLQFVLNEDTIEDIVVVITVDLSRPWTIIESLERWTKVLADHIATFGESEKVAALKAATVKYFQTYKDVVKPNADIDSDVAAEGETLEGEGEGDGQAPEGEEKAEEDGEGGETNVDLDDEDLVLELDEDVLTTNFGVPLIVVGTKADSSSSLEQDKDYRNEHFDFIQLNVRRFCLGYGAGVFYTSKDGKNTDELYKYILHCAYGFKFPFSATIGERDAVIIPRGWDSNTKISVLYDGLKSFDQEDPYSSVIQPPATRTTASSRIVEAEDEQEFLKKQQTLLGKAREISHSKPSAASPRNSPMTTRRAIPAAASSASSGAAPASSSGTAAAPAAAGGAAPAGGDPAAAGGNADVLANFFNSLLQSNKGAKPKEGQA